MPDPTTDELMAAAGHVAAIGALQRVHDTLGLILQGENRANLDPYSLGARSGLRAAMAAVRAELQWERDHG